MLLCLAFFVKLAFSRELSGLCNYGCKGLMLDRELSCADSIRRPAGLTCVCVCMLTWVGHCAVLPTSSRQLTAAGSPACLPACPLQRPVSSQGLLGGTEGKKNEKRDGKRGHRKRPRLSSMSPKGSCWAAARKPWERACGDSV
jgi:hypothetical protein